MDIMRTGREKNVHALPFREQVHINLHKKKKPKAKKRHIPLEGFQPLTTGRLQWKGDQQKPIIDVGLRKPSRLDVYLKFVDVEVVQSIIEHHVYDRGKHRPKPWEIYTMHAIKMSLHVSTKRRMLDNFPIDRDKYPEPMGKNAFIRLEMFFFLKETV